MRSMLLFLSIAWAQISIDLQSNKGYRALRRLSSTNLYNKFFYYTGKLWIGTPGQPFDILFDTGSSDIWVDVSSCKSCTVEGNKFNPSESSTYKNLTTKISGAVMYVDDTTYFGYLTKDIIYIGDNSKISAHSYFVLIYEESGNEGVSFNGIAGLAFSSLSDGHPTLIDSLKSTGQISRRIFAMYINYFPGTDGIYGSPSSNLMIGHYDLGKYSTTGKVILTIPLTSDPYYWSIYIDTAFVNSTAIGNNIPMIVDSGTSFILMDNSYFSKVKSYLDKHYTCIVDSAEYIQCQCTGTNMMTDISISYNGVKLTAKKNTLWYYENGVCLLLVINFDFDGVWILGANFMANYYTIFDMDNKEISFAPAVTASNSTSAAKILLIHLIVLAYQII